MKNGLLLINLGTPDHCTPAAVKRYLREFLADKRVIDLPAPLRYLILHTLILPFRPKQAAHAYKAIWDKEGSPLLINSRKLQTKLQCRLGEEYKVVLGMRYGNPSISEALDEVNDCERLTVLPLFPQYSSAATGSAIEKLLKLLATQKSIPTLTVIRDFYHHPGFIKAQAALIEPYLASHDYLLFSYHGIPERHLAHHGCQTVCANSCPPITQSNQVCYKAQCYMTTRELVRQLNLTKEQYGMAFQSRLGKTPWIKPYTDALLPKLAQQGIKRVAIACPSFVADCLETLEEIGIRAKEQWQRLGGVQLSLIPCLNDTDLWVTGLIEILKNK
ncbi:ferrochelatase [Legionella lansingensis]|uniref:Ferrochelatase n=1 Tax=Legionella lansingensis TaxID=45067 RepID=A0A0W0VWJ5_9GAMM|nr:ferrochelatase [Legionella lansingensis]KTD24708.1 ferrochelatase [Legionella lansingensis]SNV53496.1 ferrochelatase [Legionella lansingensis]